MEYVQGYHTIGNSPYADFGPNDHRENAPH